MFNTMVAKAVKEEQMKQQQLSQQEDERKKLGQQPQPPQMDPMRGPEASMAVAASQDVAAPQGPAAEPMEVEN